MSAHLSLRETRENGTFVKLQHILVFLNILYILCVIMLSGDVLRKSFDFGIHISITYQNSPKLVFFIYFYGFKLLVWYNLVLCYSLDPV